MFKTNLLGDYAFIQDPEWVDSPEKFRDEIRVWIRLISEADLEVIVQTDRGKLIKIPILELRMEQREKGNVTD